MLTWWQWLLMVVALVASTIYATLWMLEDTFLLHPSPCLAYLSFDPQTTEYIKLKTGGLLLHCTKTTNTTNRLILCLHGNAGNLDGMSGIAQRLLELGYDVYLMEPFGYGICSQSNSNPTTESLVNDLREAWSKIPTAKRSDAILWGFSMGGGVICQFLKDNDNVLLNDDDLPAQIALLNTYYDLPMLVVDVFPIPGVSWLMRTQWNASQGIQNYCERTKRNNNNNNSSGGSTNGGNGNILIVAALDDELIPMKHAHLLHKCIHDTQTQRKLITLPNGGHNNSIETHFDIWLPALLPSTLSNQFDSNHFDSNLNDK